MTKAQKNRASKHAYQSPTQFVLEGFETTLSRNLRQDNRWVKLAHQIPWDILVETYQKQLKNDADRSIWHKSASSHWLNDYKTYVQLE